MQQHALAHKFSASRQLLMALLLFATMATAQVNPFKLESDSETERVGNRLYQQAMALYRNGEYWSSSQQLIKLIDEFPGYSNMDAAVHTLANCLYELGMSQSAKKIYKHIVQKYITSPYVPEALVGLQRIEYEQNNLAASLKYYDALSRGTPSQDVIDLAAYYAGMAYYKMENYPRCAQVLQRASPSSPYYDYILYTLAVSMLRMKQVYPAIDFFESLFELPVINDERRHVLNEAHLTVGYFYYELEYFDKAIQEFQQISAGSAQHPHALLAWGWSAAQQNMWQDAIAPLTKLYTTYESNDLAQEGLFLLGRCYLKLGRYDEAIGVYDFLIDMFPDQEQVISSTEKININIQHERERIEKRQLELMATEQKLMDDLNLRVNDESLNINQDNLTKTQSDLIKNLQNERKSLDLRLKQLHLLATDTAIQEQRRNWKAYAEYGKSRASFLKRQQQRRLQPESTE